MLSITNHIGVVILLLVIYIISDINIAYHKQLRTDMNKKDIKKCKGLWLGIKKGINMFCIFEVVYWFIIYFFVWN